MLPLRGSDLAVLDFNVMQKLNTIFLLLLAMTATTFGDIFMARLLRPYEGTVVTSASQVLHIALAVVTAPTFWIAVACFATFYFTWMSVLSYEDLSFALPMTATTYIFNALLAGPMLGEKVNLTRWIGTLIIGLGVVIVSLSQGKKKQPEQGNVSDAASSPPAQSE